MNDQESISFRWQPWRPPRLPTMGFAQEAEAPPAGTDEVVWIFNTLLFLVGGFLVFWMAAGFAMLEGGLVRSKNVTMQMTKNIALFSDRGDHVLADRLQPDVSARRLGDRRLFLGPVRPGACSSPWAWRSRMRTIRPTPRPGRTSSSS
jgi:hypothetical protein